jgi:ABC-type dipeptide/oligopeptide/nickel transport system ATPase component
MIELPKNTLLALQELRIAFTPSRIAPTVSSSVSIEVHMGECVALVGESGSGKTITCLAALGLLRGATISGRLFWKEKEFDLSLPRSLAPLRGRQITMLPQNFAGAFNPVRTIGAQMTDVIRFHHGGTKHAALERAASLLAELGVSESGKRLHEYPHQQSGGILQRTALAMALSCEPELLIADEPTAALDVTSQQMLLDLLSRVEKSRNLALLLVSHNLAVVGHLARRVYVMEKGRIMETGATREILANPKTDSTARLLHAAQALGLP